MNIARNLKKYRELNGMTQKDLAVELTKRIPDKQFKHNSVSSWESGTNSIDVTVLFEICKILNVSIDKMYEDESVGESYEVKESSCSYDRKSMLPDMIKLIKIPVLGVIRAGEPMYAEHNIVDYAYYEKDKAKSPLGFPVGLKKTTWEYKICNYYNTNDDGKNGNSHEDMRELLEEVKNSMDKPHLILPDTKIIILEDGTEKEIESETRQEHVRFYFDSNDDRLRAIRTIIEIKNNIGDVVTSHKVSRIKDIKKGGRILYDSSTK